MKRLALLRWMTRSLRRKMDLAGGRPLVWFTALTCLALAALPAGAIIDNFDFGDAPLPYPTRARDGGAQHRVVQGLQLGQFIDSEFDGAPSNGADGDDINPLGTPDDEDGVVFLSLPLVPGSDAQVRVIASENGRLDAWIDFDASGSWDRFEKIFDARPLNPGGNILTFTVPAGATIGGTYARFRFSQQGTTLPTGSAPDGEVEDYLVEIGGEQDYGDAPQVYPTLRGNNGARHTILKGFFLGKLVDAESDGQASSQADGDDLNPPGAADDEDGVRFLDLPLNPGSTARIEVDCSLDGRLDAWVDFNGNGDWTDAGEQIFTSVLLAPGTNPLSFTVPATAAPGATTFARFRFSLEGNLGPAGPAPDGEVEDYQVSIGQSLDFGDAPDSYRTTLAQNGPRHPSSQFFLGSFIDLEPDGQPNSGATGDDKNPVGAADDEDGVSFSGPLSPGNSAAVVVTANISGRLDAWVDFAGDGSFAEAGDQIFNSQTLTSGPNTLSFNVPTSAKPGPTFARFRFSRSGKLPYFGPANDGEVEDYRVTIQELWDFGDAPDPSYPTLLASNGARHRRNPDVFLGFRIDEEADGQPNADATGDDLNPSSFPSDEDGVVSGSESYLGRTVTVDIRASTSGFLNAWVDFGGDGSWAEPGDQIWKDVPLTGGTNTLTFDIPSDAKLGRTYARLRFNLQGGLSYDGPAPDGEVEDYALDIRERPVRCTATNKGDDFWLTFPGNYAPDPDNPLRLRLCIAGPRTTTGTVEIPGLGWSTNWTITFPERVIIDLPEQAELGDANDFIQNNGIHVTANAEVAVFGMNRVRWTTDGYLGLPSDVLGREYLIQAFGNVHSGAPPLNGTQFGLVACEDNTVVTVVPSVDTTGHPKGVPFSFVLNRGETYQLRNTNDAPADLSGTFVTADKPFAAFGSHRCANIPDEKVWFCDYIVEQLLPTDRASGNFVSMPLQTRTGGDIYRIYALQDNTQVFVNGPQVAILNRGEWHEMKIVGPAHIFCEGAIQVMQYSTSSDFDMVTDADPFSIEVPPIEMWRTEYEICVPESGFVSHYLNVMVASANIGDIRLDGAVIPAGDYVPIGTSGFHGAQVAVTPGRHTVVGFHFSASTPGFPVPFGAVVYGWAEYDSYGYPAGMFFSDKTPPTVICLETNIVFPAGFGDAGPCEAFVPDVVQLVTFTDNCPLSPNTVVRQTPPAGTRVPVGEHTIVVSVSDAAGNVGTCEITLTVVDTSDPSISCPGEIIANCENDRGARVTFNVTGTSSCKLPLPVQCDPPSGSFFPTGVTTVNCVATNGLGITATCSFPVTVRCLNIGLGPDGTVVITWSGGGVLQSSSTLTDPRGWNDLSLARSPHTVTPNRTNQFYRVRY